MGLDYASPGLDIPLLLGEGWWDLGTIGLDYAPPGLDIPLLLGEERGLRHNGP